MSKKSACLDLKSKVGNAKVYRCPICFDGAKLEKANGLVAAYKMLSDGQGKLMQAFRTGVSPKESTFVKLRKAREALAAAIKETEGE